MRSLLLTASIICYSIIATAQLGTGAVAPMTALNSGDISSLDNVKKVNIIYNYSELGVGAFRKEQDYIDNKCAEYEKKEPGKGRCEAFKASWLKGREERFEPTFQELFNKYGSSQIDMSGTNYSKEYDYTLIVNSVFIEPGVNVGFYKKPAFIDLECIFKDKAGNDLCKFYVKNAIGSQVMGFDYDVTSRLKESYAKAAKMLVAGVAKERKKKKK